ncbi:hypothetical protein ACVW0I_002207 [Bradyrhizobium sp. LM6.11]
MLSRSMREREATATETCAVAQILSNSFSRASGVRRLESSMPRGMRSGSRITAAATTGPASGPRPASSQPATGQIPHLNSARSRRKLGGTMMALFPPASALANFLGAAFLLLGAAFLGAPLAGFLAD